jgi:hypothetical protein
LRLRGQPASLVIVQDNPLLAQLLLEHIVLCALELDDLLLLLIDT